MLTKKTLGGHVVIFVAETPRADQWMQQRYRSLKHLLGKPAMVFRSDLPDQKAEADALEASARALVPPLGITTVGERFH